MILVPTVTQAQEKQTRQGPRAVVVLEGPYGPFDHECGWQVSKVKDGGQEMFSKLSRLITLYTFQEAKDSAFVSPMSVFSVDCSGPQLSGVGSGGILLRQHVVLHLRDPGVEFV